MAAAASLGAGVILAPGCTFGDLADYPIGECDPSQPQATDACERLNADPATCTAYRCDAATKRCVQAARDDDRDGDPPVACGGTDCDDHDPNRSGRAAERCDLVDNDCDGLVDEGVLAPGRAREIGTGAGMDVSFAPDGARRSFIAAAVTKTSDCIQIVRLDPGGGTPPECIPSGALNAPRQPYALNAAGIEAMAFVSTDSLNAPCPSGSVRYANKRLASWYVECDPNASGSMPAFAAMPQSAGGDSAVLAWMTERVRPHDNAVGACATTAIAPLQVKLISSLSDSTAGETFLGYGAERSGSTRPPALLPVEQAGGVLLAAPIDDRVGVWMVGPKSGSLRTPARVPIPNAGAVSVAARAIDASMVGLAVAAEVGCRPSASIEVSLGTYDPSEERFSFAPSIGVASKKEIATATSVAWVASRSEWWVQWLEAGAVPRVQRLTPDGKLIGDPVKIAPPLSPAAVSAAESVFGVTNDGRYVEVPLTCPK